MARKRSKAFWNNFKFKYKLTIINENTLEEIVGLRVSKLNGLDCCLYHCLHPFAQLPSRLYEQ